MFLWIYTFRRKKSPLNSTSWRHAKVWFDADDGRRLLAELNLRCEAGWRYSAADQEERLGRFFWKSTKTPGMLGLGVSENSVPLFTQWFC